MNTDNDSKVDGLNKFLNNTFVVIATICIVVGFVFFQFIDFVDPKLYPDLNRGIRFIVSYTVVIAVGGYFTSFIIYLLRLILENKYIPLPLTTPTSLYQGNT
jgi:Sec-independent protein secretion pathway component TatC